MKAIPIVLLLVSTGLIFTTCKKDHESVVSQLQTVSVKDLPADTIIGLTSQGQPYGSGQFTLFSFEQNRIIDNADSASSKWDIGFRGTTIITNGGSSGPGAGGAFLYVGTFADLKTVPVDSVFRADNAPAAYAIQTGSGNGWYTYNPVTQLINPIPGRILVIRTAGGKYAKVEILNYYKGGTTPDASAPDNEKLSKQRYYSFNFVYQSDGTGRF